MNKYITTTLPYVNADPHIGFALEIVQADALARFWRLQGHKVVFNTGTDEHGQKIFDKAVAEKMDPQEYCDIYAAKFDRLKKALNLTYTDFTRTTDPRHIRAAGEFWKRCLKNNDIYKKNYRIKYCIGCELEKTDSELVDNRCPLHPNAPLEIIEEENYFFRFSRYQQPLLNLFANNPDFIVPDYRLKEISEFVKAGLQDFSVSRLKKKMPWGIEVPGDPDHVMYVWFDALINYISVLGWPENINKFEDFWPGFQIAGKDNLRQQSAIWQSMLLSAGLPPTKKIFIHGFITSNGQKMSKSLGNVTDPFGVVEKFGTDAVRYYLLREIPASSDGDYSEKRMIEIYNTELANELGNLVSRLTRLAETDSLAVSSSLNDSLFDGTLCEEYENFRFDIIWSGLHKRIKELNRKINEKAPWQLAASERKEFLEKCLTQTSQIGYLLQPLLPQTAEKLLAAVNGKIKTISPLFPRLKY